MAKVTLTFSKPYATDSFSDSTSSYVVQNMFFKQLTMIKHKMNLFNAFNNTFYQRVLFENVNKS